MIVSQMSIFVANWDLGVAATEGGSETQQQESELFLSVWIFATHH